MAALLLLQTVSTADTPHTGVAKVRTGPELSDVALFVMACLGVWIVRRAMRARFARLRRDSATKD